MTRFRGLTISYAGRKARPRPARNISGFWSPAAITESREKGGYPDADHLGISEGSLNQKSRLSASHGRREAQVENPMPFEDRIEKSGGLALRTFRF